MLKADATNQELAHAESMRQMARVAVKIPQFWTEDMDLWLDQVDATFTISKITY
jgi:hypothetical protein